MGGAKMKAFTDIEQSKKLAEILPIESADMIYYWFGNFELNDEWYELSLGTNRVSDKDIYAWSLAALLDVLQNTAYSINEDANVMLDSYKTVEWDLEIDNSDLELITEANPIDACYEMILKLHEQKFL